MAGISGTRSGRVRVLIVDDEPALTEVLSVAVAEAGRRPCPAGDGQSALRMARGCAPHAVVPDGMLPDLDGLQVLRRLRHENPKLPVLMLTARDAVEHGPADDSVRVLGDLVLTGKTREVHRAGQQLQLTAKEFDLLSLLLSHPRQVLSKAQILDHVWSGSFDGDGNLVDVCISSLRRKIDKGRAPMIHTVRGTGYAIRPVEEGR